MFTKTQTLESLFNGLPISPHPGTSAKTVKAIKKHNEAVNTLTASLADGKARLTAVVEGAADSDNPHSVGIELDAAGFDKIAAAQTAVRLWKQRIELATTMAGELAEKIDPATKAAVDAHQKVEAAWKGVGFGAEQMIGWPDQAASDRQLRHFVLRHTVVAETTAEAASCEARHQGTVAQIHASTRGEQTARSFLTVMAQRQAEAVA